MTQPEHGTILGFETDPAFDWDPPTGRFGAIKILGVDQWGNRVVATLAGVFTTMPTLADVATAPVLTLNRFSFNGRPAVFGTSGFDAATQDSLTPLGVVSITDHERRLAEACATISAPSRCMFNLEAEWRWEHDHHDYIASHERKKADDDERRRQADERYETRLKGLTWGQLRDETHFDRWKPSPPFPPPRSPEALKHTSGQQLTSSKRWVQGRKSDRRAPR